MDLDGWEDALIANGFAYNMDDLDTRERIRAMGPLSVRDSRRNVLMYPRLDTPNVAFRNQHDLTFRELGQEWGFDSKQVCNGMALADLDNDGDLDVVVNNLNAAAGLYRNNAAAPRVAVRLRGAVPNTRGIGARIRVTGGPVPQTQEMVCGGRYLSCDDTMRVFAAGTLTNHLRIEVAWRNGKRSVVADAQPNCLYEILEAWAEPAPAAPPAQAPRPVFEDVSERLGHRHQEEPFDDFARQPLLPKRLSQLGPGVCWWDVDGDGWEDLIIGSGKGGQLACYHNDGKGSFKRLAQPPWTATVNRDQVGIAGWTAGTVLVGSANYEDGQTNGAAVNAFGVGQGQPTEVVAAWEGSVGPLAVADYDGDGKLDAFVVASAFLEGTNTVLYRNDGHGVFTDVSSQSGIGALRGNGLGVVAADFDDDGWPEVFVANDSMANFLFHTTGHLRFDEVALRAGVAVATDGRPRAGMGVDAGDYDGDGQLDLVVTNLDAEMHSLYRGLGRRLFTYATPESGIGPVTLPFVGFGVVLFDFDNDAQLDLAIVNGHVIDNTAMFRAGSTHAQRKLLLRNTNGRRFVDVGRQAGAGFAKDGVGRTLVVVGPRVGRRAHPPDQRSCLGFRRSDGLWIQAPRGRMEAGRCHLRPRFS